jgi:hypothetical protein
MISTERHPGAAFSPTLPVREGRNLSLSDSEKKISGRGMVAAAPRPEKFFEFFDPPSRGGWEKANCSAYVTMTSV